VSTPYESFRAQLRARTPEGAPTVVIVTRQSDHRAGQVWVTFYGSWRGTVCLIHSEVDELVALLGRAKEARL